MNPKSSLFGSAPGGPPPPPPKLDKKFPDIDFEVPKINLYAPPYSADETTQQRNKYVTKLHTIPDKMLLYNSSTQGKLDDLKALLIEKGFSVTEEVSKEGHFWTVLHYATHYGHIHIVEFLLDFLKNKDEFYEILNLQTIEGKTPLFCSILSGDIKIDMKKDIIKLLFDTQ